MKGDPPGVPDGRGPFTTADLAVVLPVRPGAPALSRVLEALAAQSTGGFTTVVVLDEPSRVDHFAKRPGVRVLATPEWSRAVAANAGARLADTALLLFLGDDVIADPALVERHLRHHNEHPDPKVTVLGPVELQHLRRPGPLERWADSSGLRFDTHAAVGRATTEWEAFHWSNVSLKRELLDASGGFDETFAAYADLDAGWRLVQEGMVLHRDPGAVTRRSCRSDAATLRSELVAIGRGERAMAAKHPWYDPPARRRVLTALDEPRVPSVWPDVAGRFAFTAASGNRVSARVATAHLQRLGPWLLNGWDGERAVEELRAYLGDTFDERLLRDHQAAVDAEEEAAPDEATFYRTSQAYLYDLTAFSMWDTKVPYLEDLCRYLGRGARLLDYGCGIGADGLRLLDRGYQVDFADFDNPSTAYLRWRLEHRGLDAAVHDLDLDVPAGFDAAFSFDVIEHVDDPFQFLAELEARAAVVAVNFLEPDPADTHLHRPLPISRLLDHCADRGLLRYRRYHGRSHVVVYRPRSGRSAGARLQRVLGPRVAAASAILP